MVTYPVRVPRDGYWGKDGRRRQKAARHNQVAEELEKYINEKIAADPSAQQTYYYHLIALDLNLPLDEVERILFSLDCGHNGFTVSK